ncbi:SDR family NAD(P)-dependent oxidoreductase [Spiroplasma endosymbiont of Melieria omissa]|uniref:SDR family NAD(P)-dependent oxidoreductase n=1 Tax=Spiroplasma endosymbiont of Melieria omissa TaxID=3139324 RepID=UPI003CCA83D1
MKDWDETIDVNIKGTLYGIGASLPLMYQQNSGHIINISSIAGHFLLMLVKSSLLSNKMSG